MMTGWSGRTARLGLGQWANPVLVLALLPLALACGAVAGRVWLDDAALLLNRARVEAAAEPLRARGAIVAVVVVPSGDGEGADFARRLAGAGLLAGEEIVADGVAVYVSRTPRYSEVRVGRRWSGIIDRESLGAIRRESLNPALSGGDVTGGVVAALLAAEERLTAGRSFDLPWPIIGPLAGTLAVAAGATLWFLRRRERLARDQRRLARAAARLAAARQAVTTAAEEARAVVAAATALKPGQRQDFQAHLGRLDTRRPGLETQALAPGAPPIDLEGLAGDYQALTATVRRILAERAMTPQERQNRRRRARPSSGSSSYGAASAATSQPDDDWSSTTSETYGPSSGGGGESRDGGSY